MVKNCISRLGFLVLERWSHTHWIHVDWSKIYLHLWKSTIHVGKQTSHMYPMMGIHIWSWQVGSSNPRRPVARILGFPNSVTRTNNRFLPALCKKQHQDFCQFVSAFFLLGTRIKLMNFWVSASWGDRFTKKTGFIETDPRPPNPNPRMMVKRCFWEGLELTKSPGWEEYRL